MRILDRCLRAMILVRRQTENNFTPADVCHNVARCADGGGDGDGDDDDDALDSHRVPVALQIYCRSVFNCAMSQWHLSSPSG
jgi:hypothetical protein